MSVSTTFGHETLLDATCGELRTSFRVKIFLKLFKVRISVVKERACRSISSTLISLPFQFLRAHVSRQRIPGLHQHASARQDRKPPSFISAVKVLALWSNCCVIATAGLIIYIEALTHKSHIRTNPPPRPRHFSRVLFPFPVFSRHVSLHQLISFSLSPAASPR